MKNALVLVFLCFFNPVMSTVADEPVNEEQFAPKAFGMTLPVITDATTEEERRKLVGRLVAVRGTIPDTKIPRIAGVEVSALFRGRDAYAVGILIRYERTKEQIREMNRLGLQFDGSRSGYILYFDPSGKIAKARLLGRQTEDSE